MTTIVIPIESKEEYESLLKAHDWYYAYSDDHSVWDKGFRQFYKLVELQRYYDESAIIWNQYAPDKEFKIGEDS